MGEEKKDAKPKIQTAMPKGFCKDCRWSWELDPKIFSIPISLGLTRRCRGAPLPYQIQAVPTNVRGIDGKPKPKLAAQQSQIFCNEYDCCSFFEPRPKVGSPEHAEAELLCAEAASQIEQDK